MQMSFIEKSLDYLKILKLFFLFQKGDYKSR